MNLYIRSWLVGWLVGWLCGVWFSELSSFISLTKTPGSRCHIQGGYRVAITSSDKEGDGLSHKILVALPVLTPVSGHWDPVCHVGSFHGDCTHISRATHIAHQHQIEVRIAIDGEPNPSTSCAIHPTVRDHHPPIQTPQKKCQAPIRNWSLQKCKNLQRDFGQSGVPTDWKGEKSWSSGEKGICKAFFFTYLR